YLNRLPDAIAIQVLAHKGPIIFPLYRLKVRDTPIGIHILKMDKPISAIGSIHPPPLMWAIDLGRPLFQYNFFFVGTIDVLRTQDQLPTCGHSACRRKNVVVAIPFVEFWAFHGWMGIMTVKDHGPFIEYLCPFGIHLVDGQNALDRCAAPSVC